MANYSFPTNNDNETFTNLLNNVTKMLTDEIKNLSVQVVSINDVLSQKTQGLEDDIHAQKVMQIDTKIFECQISIFLPSLNSMP